ncbi:hypothetical protein QRD89_07755 [Halobacillus sp. ACCC02827]|uniref:hypothetical protein n=1 Tax=Bacillaceae TaxID=186817 RepID=UPI0002A4E26C|nr:MULTISPECIES: hypothetical protein [Bacillaceae]ELK45431.1 hypothetical protein D479_14962 [Halobacillus sp. BAB-2008]QHT46422.1 hypothetical protein M662_07930 [Bacillus sp. SB49]WJE17230.1 hypothetical protein QRD89_07755 [Halobacillus sp. ACCC02827]
MGLLELYPWIAPVLLLVSIATLFASYFSLKSRKYMIFTALGMVQTFISLNFATTVGPILFGIGLIQFYAGLVNIKRVKAMRHE